MAALLVSSTASGKRSIMAKRKKRSKVQPKKRAKPGRRRAAVRGKARAVSESARGKATKPAVARTKPKRVATKKAMRKKEQRMKPPGSAVETVVIDVIEEPAPGRCEAQQNFDDITEADIGTGCDLLVYAMGKRNVA